MRIGIDLGGTKIEGIALDDRGGERVRQRVPTPPHYAGTVDAIGALVEALEADVGPGTVGVGIPGSLGARTGRVRNANSTWLNGRPLGADLEARLGRPVRVANDANCFALSEATDGAGAGADVVVGVILGTGVGGGVVVGGRVLEGAGRIAGEWGHVSLPWPGPDERPGPPCYCGQSGCVETFLSGPALARDHRTTTGDALDAPEIARRAAAGDAGARATLARYADRLGRGLAMLANVLDPDVIVLGGGVSNLDGLAEAAAAAMTPYVFAPEVATRVVRNAHGDSSGVRGAAWLWPSPAPPGASG